jgi:hypothetical protein
VDTIVAGTSAAAMAQNRQSGTGQILTCAGPAPPLADMVALLRNHDAPPPSGAAAPPGSGLSRSGMRHARALVQSIDRRGGKWTKQAGVSGSPDLAEIRNDSE